MKHKKEMMKARILIYCSQANVSKCGVHNIALQFRVSRAYIGECVFELESEGILKRTRVGNKQLITALSSSAVEEAKKMYVDKYLASEASKKI